MANAAHKLHPIAFELLRHGPPHNQLLSKITDYVALCGNFGAETLRLPFNHLEHQMNLEALSYNREGKAADFMLDKMGNLMSDLLGSVPGLPPALSQAKDSKCDMAHLRLVLTPNELALLPFECATVPKGAPGGAGSKLLLQTNAPVTMTREVRGLTASDVYWPAQPKILFAWAAPLDDVPYEEHLLALRRALTPWLKPYRGSGGDKEAQDFLIRQIKQIVTILPRASIEDIYQACASSSFTHVHILAHGIPSDEAGDQQTIGLALHSRGGLDKEIIDGRRLANALRFHDGSAGELPAMVVLATCDSGRVRSVLTYGGSIAHELHIAGVPLVVASQFPLSKSGSIVMADELYRRIFQAEDPRVAMHFVRRRLFSACGDCHDWASLVVYASLPRDFEAQLAEIQFKVAKRRIDQLLDEADTMIDRTTTELTKRTRQCVRMTGEKLTPEEAYEKLMMTLDALEGPAKEILERTEDRLEGLGLQASTKKRKAEVLFWASQQTHVMDSKQRSLRSRSLTALAEARELYYKAMKLNMSRHWVGVQYLVLTAVLHAAGKLRDNYSDDVWTAIKVSAESELNNPSIDEQAWAHASLMELYILKSIRPDVQPPLIDFKIEALNHAERILELVSSDSFIIYSTCRQLDRYIDWWSNPLDPKSQRQILFVSDIANEARQRLLT